MSDRPADESRIAALRQALELAADNHPLRLLLAEMLRDANRLNEALEQYAFLIRHNALAPADFVPVGRLALQAGDLNMAGACLALALQAGHIDGTAALQADLDARCAEQGMIRVVLPAGGPPAPKQSDPDGSPAEQARITFEDVGGLEAVKKVIHRLIILPLMRPDLYRRYGKQTGGGVLLYGPPGCGKTLLARATAGECRLPFLNIRIEDILDPYQGISERNLHGAFELARAQAPCVLFIDELDALAYARRKQQGNIARSLVDQLLQELDAIGAENPGLLVMAATNAPWDIDDALLRPGRLSQRIFVPPPDEEARHQILSHLVKALPTSALDLRQMARVTPLFSGADLRAVVERATDQVIEEALASQAEPPLSMKHLNAALAGIRPTTLDWLTRARSYVEFANQDDRYKEIADYLRSREARSWRSQ